MAQAALRASAERRVVISSGQAAETGASWQGKSLQLRHPATGQQAAFIFRGGCLQEVNLVKPTFGSWFADENVIEDGSLYLCSDIDPLFLTLPLLEACSHQTTESEGLFQDADQIFASEAAEISAILREAAEPQLPTICDVKEVDGKEYFRISNGRVLAWLKCKVQRTVAALRSVAGNFSGMDEGSLEAYAVGVLGEYLSAFWLGKLQNEYQCQPGHAAAQPLTDCIQHRPRDNFDHITKKIKLDQKEVARKRAKEAADEKKAAQLRRETTGMKKMSSFFKPSAKQP